jgi:hypothetical protein
VRPQWSIRNYLYGRQMYETMLDSEIMPLDGQPPFLQDFEEIWRAAEKIVYSKTLAS